MNNYIYIYHTHTYIYIYLFTYMYVCVMLEQGWMILGWSMSLWWLKPGGFRIFRLWGCIKSAGVGLSLFQPATSPPFLYCSSRIGAIYHELPNFQVC